MAWFTEVNFLLRWASAAQGTCRGRPGVFLRPPSYSLLVGRKPGGFEVCTALLLLGSVLACGGQTTENPPPAPAGVAGSSAGGAGGGTGTGGVCSLKPCSRFPEGDPECLGDGFIAYACSHLETTPAACTYRILNCKNCIDWCCPASSPVEPLFAPHLISLKDGVIPDGCIERPEYRWICEAQGKPLRALVCEGEEIPLDCRLSGYAACSDEDKQCILGPHTASKCPAQEKISCCP